MASNNYLGTKDIQEMFPEIFNKKLPCIEKNHKKKVDRYKIKNNGCDLIIKIKHGRANINITNIYY